MHLGARAVGGTSLVIPKATAVSPEGRIPPVTRDWNDKQAEACAKVLPPEYAHWLKGR